MMRRQHVMHRVMFVVRERSDLQTLATNNSGDSGTGPPFFLMDSRIQSIRRPSRGLA